MTYRTPPTTAQWRSAWRVLDRLAGQKATSTERRDQFTITRAELDALLTIEGHAAALGGVR